MCVLCMCVFACGIADENWLKCNYGSEIWVGFADSNKTWQEAEHRCQRLDAHILNDDQLAHCNDILQGMVQQEFHLGHTKLVDSASFRDIGFAMGRDLMFRPAHDNGHKCAYYNAQNYFALTQCDGRGAGPKRFTPICGRNLSKSLTCGPIDRGVAAGPAGLPLAGPLFFFNAMPKVPRMQTFAL